jgi:uncharacterized protein (DUF1697 family)
VALLRGINVGRARQVDMPRLREVLTARGHEGVRTHLRSGNVLLDSPLEETALAAEVETALREEFGFEVPVVVRTGRELAAVLAEDPLGDRVTDPSRYSVTFLPEAPAKAKLRELPPAEGGEYAVLGRELYLWLPDGMGRSATARWNWDRLLGVPGTGRNWNTVEALARLTA